MRTGGRYLECAICKVEVAVFDDEEFNWVDETGPYCDVCNQWMTRIAVLQAQVDELVSERQRDDDERQRQENMRRVGHPSPYDLSAQRRNTRPPPCSSESQARSRRGCCACDMDRPLKCEKHS
jgi:hypothetical protein